MHFGHTLAPCVGRRSTIVCGRWAWAAARCSPWPRSGRSRRASRWRSARRDAVVAVVAYKLVDLLVGLRVAEVEEREGLDITSHGESAYHQ